MTKGQKELESINQDIDNDRVNETINNYPPFNFNENERFHTVTALNSYNTANNNNNNNFNINNNNNNNTINSNNPNIPTNNNKNNNSNNINTLLQPPPPLPPPSLNLPQISTMLTKDTPNPPTTNYALPSVNQMLSAQPQVRKTYYKLPPSVAYRMKNKNYAEFTKTCKEIKLMTNQFKDDYNLLIRQQPAYARCSAFSDKERRPIDPPPIVQLIFGNEKSNDNNNSKKTLYHTPFFFMTATLIKGSEPKKNGEEDKDGSNQGRESEVSDKNYIKEVNGLTVASLTRMKDFDNSYGAFFIFHDMGVSLEGTFKIKFSLFEIVGLEKKVYYRKSILSNNFKVLSPKEFPGMQESSPLARLFAEQGLKIRIRKEKALGRNPNKRIFVDLPGSEYGEGSGAKRPTYIYIGKYPKYSYREIEKRKEIILESRNKFYNSPFSHTDYQGGGEKISPPYPQIQPKEEERDFLQTPPDAYTTEGSNRFILPHHSMEKYPGELNEKEEEYYMKSRAMTGGAGGGNGNGSGGVPGEGGGGEKIAMYNNLHENGFSDAMSLDRKRPELTDVKMPMSIDAAVTPANDINSYNYDRMYKYKISQSGPPPPLPSLSPTQPLPPSSSLLPTPNTNKEEIMYTECQSSYPPSSSSRYTYPSSIPLEKPLLHNSDIRNISSASSPLPPPPPPPSSSLPLYNESLNEFNEKMLYYRKTRELMENDRPGSSCSSSSSSDIRRVNERLMNKKLLDYDRYSGSGSNNNNNNNNNIDVNNNNSNDDRKINININSRKDDYQGPPTQTASGVIKSSYYPETSRNSDNSRNDNSHTSYAYNTNTMGAVDHDGDEFGNERYFNERDNYNNEYLVKSSKERIPFYRDLRHREKEEYYVRRGVHGSHTSSLDDRDRLLSLRRGEEETIYPEERRMNINMDWSDKYLPQKRKLDINDIHEDMERKYGHPGGVPYRDYPPSDYANKSDHGFRFIPNNELYPNREAYRLSSSASSRLDENLNYEKKSFDLGGRASNGGSGGGSQEILDFNRSNIYNYSYKSRLQSPYGMDDLRDRINSSSSESMRNYDTRNVKDSKYYSDQIFNRSGQTSRQEYEKLYYENNNDYPEKPPINASNNSRYDGMKETTQTPAITNVIQRNDNESSSNYSLKGKEVHRNDNEGYPISNHDINNKKLGYLMEKAFIHELKNKENLMENKSIEGSSPKPLINKNDYHISKIISNNDIYQPGYHNSKKVYQHDLQNSNIKDIRENNLNIESWRERNQIENNINNDIYHKNNQKNIINDMNVKDSNVYINSLNTINDEPNENTDLLFSNNKSGSSSNNYSYMNDKTRNNRSNYGDGSSRRSTYDDDDNRLRSIMDSSSRNEIIKENSLYFNPRLNNHQKLNTSDILNDERRSNNEFINISSMNRNSMNAIKKEDIILNNNSIYNNQNWNDH